MPSSKPITSALFVLSAALIGCASADVTSNKDPGFALKPERILVVLRPGPTSEVGKNVMTILSERLPGEFTRRSVQAEAVVLDGLELDEGMIARRVTEARAEAILVLVETSQVTTDGAVTGSVVEAAIVLPDTERTVWRARLNAKSAGGVFQGNPAPQYARVLTEALFKGLEDDAIIGQPE